MSRRERIIEELKAKLGKPAPRQPARLNTMPGGRWMGSLSYSEPSGEPGSGNRECPGEFGADGAPRRHCE